MPLDSRTLQPQPVERLEQLSLLLQRQPRTEVDDLDAHTVVGPDGAQQHPFAGRAVLDRIARQIADDLGQTLRIRLRDQGVALDHDLDRQPLGFRLQDQGAAHVFQQPPHVGGPQFDLDRTGFGPRHVQQVMSQGLDLTRRLDQHLRHLDLFRRGRAQLTASPQFPDADDAADRALDLMGDIGQQTRLGRRGPLSPFASRARTFSQPVALLQQRRDHQDGHIAQKDQKLRQQRPVFSSERVIRTMPGHRPADGHDRHHNQRRSDAHHPEAHRHHEQQRHQQEAVGQAQMRKNGVTGETDQPEKSSALRQPRRLAHDHQMTTLQGQPEGADHDEAQGMTEPPDSQAVEDIQVEHGVQRQCADHGGRQRSGGANRQEPGQTFDRIYAQPRNKTADQNHRQNDLQQVHGHEHDRQKRAVADQEFSRQHARHHQDAEPQIIGQTPAAAQPDRHRQPARPPEGGDQAVGASEADRQHDQDGHAHGRQDRRQGLSEEGRIGRRRSDAALCRRDVESRFSPVERSAHRHDRVRCTRLTPHPDGPS
ncbi:hypothetical protein D3C86_831080 [compost metagenome]